MELKGKQFMPAVFYWSGYGSRAQCLRSFRERISSINLPSLSRGEIEKRLPLLRTYQRIWLYVDDLFPGHGSFAEVPVVTFADRWA
jgi:hypothetical protein